MDIHRIYSPFLIYFRRQRLEFLYKLFSINESTNLLDVGGDLFFWELSSILIFEIVQIIQKIWFKRFIPIL